MDVKKYESGLTVVVQRSELRSVAAGIMVGTGSAYETPSDNGISHFIEHMQFKGTSRRTAAQIVGEFDSVGAQYNAFTGKEYTCFYFKSIDEKVEYCFDILADLFCNSKFDADELDRERKVIIEEINMSKDEPDGVCYDLLYRTAFEPPLGMEILGPKSNVERFDKADILRYKEHNYLPSNTVVVFVGNIAPQVAFELVEKYMPNYVNAPYTPPKALKTQEVKSGFGIYVHDYEQSEISVAFPSCTFSDKRRLHVSALDAIVGSGMSSRLFQRLREKMGVVYSVYSSAWGGKSNGLFSINANVNVKNAQPAALAIKNEIEKLLKDGVTEEETEKAKMQLKVSTIFGAESPMTLMLTCARWRILSELDYNLDDVIAAIDAITADDVNTIAREIFTKPAVFAYAGKQPQADIGDIFKNQK